MLTNATANTRTIRAAAFAVAGSYANACGNTSSISFLLLFADRFGTSLNIDPVLLRHFFQREMRPQICLNSLTLGR
ncbi:hypothetical protein [Rhodococcus qingshengii]|uniref:hypothetical protein n=1 Tax=Rhodococcus qingshengii TaxID=334542 RepID=UPI0021BAEDE1|nr:hypothetical protein [Rhodococcus qingshengii]UXF67259.1 hypothetical protein N6G92_28405 [Rhodococcus qingshengii]